MDRSQERRQAVDAPPDTAPDSEVSVRRMLRLYEDLGHLADEIDPEDTVCLQIVQNPERLQVYGGGNTPDIAPVLAAVLRAGLERRIAIAEHVRAELAPTWQALSKQR